MNLGRRQLQGFENGSYHDGTGAPGFSVERRIKELAFLFFTALHFRLPFSTFPQWQNAGKAPDKLHISFQPQHSMTKTLTWSGNLLSMCARRKAKPKRNYRKNIQAKM